MSRTPRFTSSSGLAGLGLVLLAAALLTGLACFFLLGAPAQGRGTHAAERGAAPARPAEEEPRDEDARGAAPVELVPAGTSLVPADAPAPAAVVQSNEQEPKPLALDAPGVEALSVTAAETQAEAPELKYVREGKTEIVNGREQRRERRSDRRERAAEAEALGVPLEKRAVESPKKNATRAQVKKVESQEGKPTRRPKTPPPAKEEAGEAPSGG